MIKFIRQKFNQIIIFKKYPVAKEFIKFCLVGFSNLILDMSGYWIFTRVFHLYYILAAVLSFSIAVTWSFFVNRRWTFRRRGSGFAGQYFKFIAANLISMALNLSLLYLFVDYGGLHDLLAKLISSFFVAFVNFTINKFWTFGKTDERPAV